MRLFINNRQSGTCIVLVGSLHPYLLININAGLRRNRSQRICHLRILVSFRIRRASANLKMVVNSRTSINSQHGLEVCPLLHSRSFMLLPCYQGNTEICQTIGIEEVSSRQKQWVIVFKCETNYLPLP